MFMWGVLFIGIVSVLLGSWIFSKIKKDKSSRDS